MNCVAMGCATSEPYVQGGHLLSEDTNTCAAEQDQTITVITSAAASPEKEATIAAESPTPVPVTSSPDHGKTSHGPEHPIHHRRLININITNRGAREHRCPAYI